MLATVVALSLLVLPPEFCRPLPHPIPAGRSIGESLSLVEVATHADLDVALLVDFPVRTHDVDEHPARETERQLGASIFRYTGRSARTKASSLTWPALRILKPEARHKRARAQASRRP